MTTGRSSRVHRRSSRDSFGVPVHDYRGRRGQVFYASPQQPAVPRDVARRDQRTRPDPRLHPASSCAAARPCDRAAQTGPDPAPNCWPRTTPASLAAQGFTGKGNTIVFFEFDGFDQDDLDSFADLSGLPTSRPIVIGGQPGDADAARP